MSSVCILELLAADTRKLFQKLVKKFRGVFLLMFFCGISNYQRPFLILHLALFSLHFNLIPTVAKNINWALRIATIGYTFYSQGTKFILCLKCDAERKPFILKEKKVHVATVYLFNVDHWMVDNGPQMDVVRMATDHATTG